MVALLQLSRVSARVYDTSSIIDLVRKRSASGGNIMNIPKSITRASSSLTDKNVDSNNCTNASLSEVNKFSSFASHWWDSRSNPLVSMNPTRVKFIRDVAHYFQKNAPETNQPMQRLPLQNKQVLDIGCGGGLLTESLSRLGASRVVGVDASSEVVGVAKVHSFHESSRLPTHPNQNDIITMNDEGLANITYLGGVTVEEFAKQWHSDQSSNELFDVITALEIVEHVPNPSSLLNTAASLLKPNGLLFVSTINRTIKSYAVAIVAAEYLTGKVPIGTHKWEQFLSPSEIESIVCKKDSSMRQVALSGMVLSPPFINMQWSLNPSDTDINWIGAYQKH